MGRRRGGVVPKFSSMRRTVRELRDSMSSPLPFAFGGVALITGITRVLQGYLTNGLGFLLFGVFLLWMALGFRRPVRRSARRRSRRAGWQRSR